MDKMPSDDVMRFITMESLQSSRDFAQQSLDRVLKERAELLQKVHWLKCEEDDLAATLRVIHRMEAIVRERDNPPANT